MLKSKHNIVKLIIIIPFIITVISLFIFIISINNGKKIDYIYISNHPLKLEYYINEEYNFDGIEITAVLNNGDENLIDLTECEIKGFDSTNVTDMQTITICYKNFSCSYFIVIKGVPSYLPVVVDIYFISLPSKLTYTVSEYLDPTGGILVCKYKDGTTKEILLSLDMIYGYTNNKPGDYILTVKYEERGIVVKTYYNITITE